MTSVCQARLNPTRPGAPLPHSAGEVKRNIAIVGKGLTFDSGGYNLKAGAGSMIEMMKVRPGVWGGCWPTGGLVDREGGVMSSALQICGCMPVTHSFLVVPADVLAAARIPCRSLTWAARAPRWVLPRRWPTSSLRVSRWVGIGVALDGLEVHSTVPSSLGGQGRLALS